MQGHVLHIVHVFSNPNLMRQCRHLDAVHTVCHSGAQKNHMQKEKKNEKKHYLVKTTYLC